jgi:hypothetical protein
MPTGNAHAQNYGDLSKMRSVTSVDHPRNALSQPSHSDRDVRPNCYHDPSEIASKNVASSLVQKQCLPWETLVRIPAGICMQTKG